MGKYVCPGVTVFGYVEQITNHESRVTDLSNLIDTGKGVMVYTAVNTYCEIWGK